MELGPAWKEGWAYDHAPCPPWGRGGRQDDAEARIPASQQGSRGWEQRPDFSFLPGTVSFSAPLVL